MARSIVGNRETSGSDQRPIARSVTAIDDRSYEQSHHPVTERTINHATADPRSSTTGGSIMHNWWYDHVSSICDRLRFGITGLKL